MPMLFEHLKFAIIQHAQDEYPHECCGAVIDGEYVRFENVAENPEKEFAFSAEDEHRLLVSEKHRTQAIVHSHPDGPATPSAKDMQAQIATQLPFVLLAYANGQWHYREFGDHRLDDPLEGREFQHGVLDCGEVIRAWYWQERQIKIPNVPRDDDWWWQEGADLYKDSFKMQGFRELQVVAMGDLQVGDVFFYRLTKAVAESHAGVYIGDDLILHHLPDRLSRKELLGPWFHRASRWVRYVGPEGGNA